MSSKNNERRMPLAVNVIQYASVVAPKIAFDA